MADPCVQPRSGEKIMECEDVAVNQPSKSIKVQTERLKAMINGYVSKVEKRSKIQTFLFHLKSQRLRNPANAFAFFQSGGVDSLLQLSYNLQKDNEEESVLLGLAWSTIANLCAFDERIQHKVVQTAVPDICQILTSCPYPNVLNSASRALGNLASSSSLISSCNGAEAMLVREITRILATHRDTRCLQSVLRTLRKLCLTGELNEELKLNQAVPIVANCLNLNDSNVSTSALQTLGTIIDNASNDELVPGLWTPDNTPLQLLGRCVEQDTPLKHMAVAIFYRCARHVDGKAALSRARGIEVLVDFLQNKDSHKNSVSYSEAVDTLCLCCRDVHGRQKIRDSNGLQLLIELVHDEGFASRHEDLLSALICYYFDEHTLRHMVRNLSLMKSLTYHLVLITEHLRETKAGYKSSSDPDVLFEIARDEPVTEPEKITIPFDEGDSEFSPFPGEAESTGGASSVSSPISSSVYNSPSSCSSKSHSLSPYSSSNNTVDVPPTCSTNSDDAMAENLPNVSSPFYQPQSIFSYSRPDSSTSSENTSAGTQFGEEDFLKACSHLSTTPTPPLGQKYAKMNLDLHVDTSTPMPANFIDSLLSSPSLHSSSQLTPPHVPTPLLSDNQDNLESKVLLLISRLSHLHDCLPLLATSENLLAILHHFLATTGANCIHSFKILRRLFLNPHCFQDCIMNHAPSLVFNEMYSESTERDTSSSSVQPPSLASPYQLSPIPVGSPSRQDMCKELFDKLCQVAESPYGQGVIAHMLLRGDVKEKTAGTLALSLLHGSPVVCHKMLTSYYGLNNLLCLSQGNLLQSTTTSTVYGEEGATEDGQLFSNSRNSCNSMQDKAMSTLLYLASRYHTRPPRKRRSSHTGIRVSNDEFNHFANPPATKKQRTEDLSLDNAAVGESLVDATCNNPAAASCYFPSSSSSPCRYIDSDHWPFDLVISVDSEQSANGTHHFPVHRSILAESSEVFSVMLGGAYQESTLNEVHLREMVPSVFNTYLHHVYGCQWPCRESKGKELTASYMENFEANIDGFLGNYNKGNLYSCSLMKEIVRSLDSPSHKNQVIHYLSVLECANRFYMPSLIERCESVLSSLVTGDNLVPMFIFSSMYGSLCLSQKCISVLISLQNTARQCGILKELLETSDGQECFKMIENIFYS